MDARLIENATDPTSFVFKDRGIYGITPKGLHVLERFITKNGIAADHLVKVFTTQPICMRLLHLERRPMDDEIIVTRPVLEVVFTRFVGTKAPNYVCPPSETARAAASGQLRPYQDAVRLPRDFERSSGIEMQDVAEKNFRNNTIYIVKHVFSSAGAIDWLCDHATCCCRDEAAELLAHFVRYGFITLHYDKSRPNAGSGPESSQNGSASGGGAASTKSSNNGATVEAEFRWGPKVTYRLTDEGRRLANWDGLSVGAGTGGKGESKQKVSTDSSSATGDADSEKGGFAGQQHLHHANGSTNTLPGQGSGNASNGKAFSGPEVGGEWSLAGGVGVSSMLDSQLHSKMTLKELFDVDLAGDANWGKEGQHSSTTRLKAILEDIRLRALFRDYLKNNYCEENLGFWLDVQDFRRRFSTTSSAIGGGGSAGALSADDAKSGKKDRRALLRFGSGAQSGSVPSASTAMEAHQHDLNIAAVNIYRLYLAPQSPSELNIDHNLRADVVNFIQRCADEANIPLSALSTPRHFVAGGSALQYSNTPNSGSGNANNASPTASPDPNNPDAAGSLGAQMVLPLRATQVQTLLRYYERIQDHIFRLLATDQVPKFIRTNDFLILLKGGNPVS